MNRPIRALFVVFLLVLASCQGTVEHYPGNTEFELALNGETLEVVNIRDVGEQTNPPVDGEAIRFVFHPASGGEVVEGEIPDTRVLRAEFDEFGQPDPQYVLASDGLFSVRVPESRGLLELWSADGEPLGEIELDPEAPLTRTAPLMRESDVLNGFVKMVNNGDRAEKVDLLFLPEGYSESEMASFRRHVQSIATQLSRKRGYQEYWSRFNVWRRDIKSRSRGAGTNGNPKDTAFETAFGYQGIDRCVFFTNARGQQAAANQGNQIGAEVVIVLVNRTQHGACARDGLIVTSRPSHVANTVAHELGHALFGLRDEYETPRPNGTCGLPGPNLSSSPRSLPWSDMVNTNRLPTPSNASSSTIGAFEGGGYCSRGRYRPTRDCMMRSHGKDFCPVCMREVARTMADYSGAVVSTGSSTGTTSSSGSGPSAPGSLSPDGVVVSDLQPRLTWGRVSGASRYELEIQRKSGSSWQRYGGTEATGTAARVTLRDEPNQYRWKVDACNNSGCTASGWASFAYGTSNSGTTSGGSTGSGSTSSGALPVPSNLQPATSTVTSDGTPSMSWNAVSGATHYGFKMLWHDGSSWKQYVPEGTYEATRVRTTLNRPEHWYGFAVRACNSSGCSEWTEYSTMYYRP